LAGVVPLREGRVVLAGELLEDPSRRVRVPAERRPVGMVFQDYLLFPHLSALENVAFGLRARGRGRAEARRAAVEWLERLGVAGLVGVNLLWGRAQDGIVELEGGGQLAAVGAGRGPVFAVVPPRSVSLWRNRPEGSPRNVWRGRVAGLDLQGDRVRVRVEGDP